MDKQLNGDQENELVKRTRRIETRLVGLIERLGYATPSQKPKFVQATGNARCYVAMPSPHTSLQEVSAVIPATHTEAVELYVGADYFGLLDVRVRN